VLFLLLCYQSTGTEIPLDLSKNCIKKLESPLDLSRKNVVTNGQEDMKPLLFGPTLQYPAPSSLSSLPATQAIRQRYIPSTSVNPVLTAFAANIPTSPLSTTLVQKVRPQTFSCTVGRQTDSSQKTCAIATAHMLSQVLSSSRCYTGTSVCSDRARAVHSGSRNVSVVKPAASSVSDIRLVMSVGQTVASNCSSQTLLPNQPIHINQKASPRYSTALFDTSRTDRGVPLAQVYPSRVVTSAAQNTTTETVPSPVHCSKELQRKSPLNNTQQPDKNCPVVCDSSSLNTAKTSSHIESVTSPPVISSPSNCTTVKSPAFIPTASTDVSPPMPILSPNISGGCSADLIALHTLSTQLCPMNSTPVKGILPPVASSPVSFWDRESIPDEDDSGHELSSSLMEWDDNVPDRRDFFSDTCHTEESSVKRPAFEVVGDCNRALLSDISRPCNVAEAFDRSLLQSESDHRNFITRTKYYRYFSRKTSAAGSGPHDVDIVQPEKCDSASVSHSTLQEQRVSVSSAVKVLRTSNASASGQQTTFPSGGKDGGSKYADDIPSKHSSFSTESNCKYDVLHKKASKLQYRQLPHNGTISFNVIGSIYSPTPDNRLKGGSRVVHSNSSVQVKSELVEDSANPESKPDILSRTVCQSHRKVVPPAFNSSSELTGSTNERSSTVGDRDKDSSASAKSLGARNTAAVKHAVCNSADACSKNVFRARSDPTKLVKSSNKVHCKKELLTESAVVDGCVNSGRKNPHDKVSGVSQKRPGDANNNQGEIHSLAESTSTVSVSESELLKAKRSTAEMNFVDGSRRSARVTVHTRSSTVSCKSDAAAAHQVTSTVSKMRKMCSHMKSKELRHSADDAASLLSSKSGKTVVQQPCVASNMHKKRFDSLLQCTRQQPVAKANLTVKGSTSESAVTASTVSDAQNKMQRSILKQLESSKGYIAEKNIKYSKSEDLFDDSSLLSREQRALRVSIISSFKIGIIFVVLRSFTMKMRALHKLRMSSLLTIYNVFCIFDSI